MAGGNDDVTRASSRPTSVKSPRSNRSQRSRTTEETPLLSRESPYRDDDEEPDYRQEQQPQSQATTLLRSLENSKPFVAAKRRWPSLVALLLLFIVIALVLVFGFFAPAAVKEYATQAVDFKPSKLSLVSLTEKGVKVRIEGDFVMDASRVQKKSVRDLGRFGTWIAKEVETDQADVNVYLPEYDNILAGKAKIPPVKVNIRNGHVNHIDFESIIEPGSFHGLRDVANDWIDGRLGEIVLLGQADISLKSGIFHLGSQTIEQSLKFEGSNIPSIPKYDIARLDIHEINETIPLGGMSADAVIRVKNDFPVSLDVPAVGFDVMVDGCTSNDAFITVGNASTHKLSVQPHKDVTIAASGDVKELPRALTKACPDSDSSPLDSFLGSYIHGDDSRIYIKCCTFPDPETPSWAGELLNDIVVPLPFPGRSFDHLLKNFSLTHVQFGLPDMFAEPGTPEASPKISADIVALVGLPEEMNFRLDVGHVRADAMIYYKHKKLGRLDLHKWQKAKSTRIDKKNEAPELQIVSHVDKAPLEIIDNDAFSEVVQTLLFGGKTLYLKVKASVDVEVDTPVGNLTIQKLPAEGVVPVQPLQTGGGMKRVRPQVGNLEIVDTTNESLTIQASVNFTNPTNYSAIVPYFNIKILNNDTVLGHAIVEHVKVVPGNNTNLVVKAVWEPFVTGGTKGEKVGRELLSQYLSGYNTTLTFQTHEGTIPAQPSIGRALSIFPIEIPTPHLRTPKPPSDGDGDDDGDDGDKDDDSTAPHFIKSTTMHLLTSAATFELISPFRKTTLYLTWLNATALYHEDVVGTILYDLPFAVPPGLSETPRLPVDWNLGSVGYDALKGALGGTLKLNASADAGVKIGQYEPRGGLWFKGRGIGAGVTL